MYIVSNVKVELEEKNIKKVIAKKLKINEKDIIEYQFYKKAIDSRNKEHIFFLCHFLIKVIKEKQKFIKENKDVKLYTPYNLEIEKLNNSEEVFVVGMGPCGLFASYILALSGAKVTLIEKGRKVDDRVKDIDKFFNEGILDVNSNLQYGEGGAGTFSDGKLTTNINDPRIEFIKNTFIKFGASKDIYYLSKPHIGSDVLINVVKNFRKELIRLGVSILFDTSLVDISIDDDKIRGIVVENNISKLKQYFECKNLVLATGHSARDVFYMLDRNKIYLERKLFSIGARIEHKQVDINKAQYGEKYYQCKELPNADYKVAVHLDNNRSLYTFCMCPGGMVVASSSNEKEIVTNGMSNYKRNEENANSALLVNVMDSDLGEGLFAGVEFQKKYEQLAYNISNSYRAPCQLLKDFFADKESINANSIKPSYSLGVFYTDLKKCLPDFVIDTFKKGIPLLDKKIKGFNNKDALLIAPETRSSSPIRIVRDESYQTNIKGIFPAGEGSGYSSGITTSALDGIRVANKVIERINNT